MNPHATHCQLPGDPLHGLKGVGPPNFFSNAFSNADDYVRLRATIGDTKRQ